MIKTYRISVDCANCANKAEMAAGKVEGVKALSISYMTQKMTVEFSEGCDENAVLKSVLKACRKVEPDFEIEG